MFCTSFFDCALATIAFGVTFGCWIFTIWLMYRS